MQKIDSVVIDHEWDNGTGLSGSTHMSRSCSMKDLSRELGFTGPEGSHMVIKLISESGVVVKITEENGLFVEVDV